MRLAFPLPFESSKPFSQSFALQPRRLRLSYKNKEINLEHVYWILRRIKPACCGNISLPNSTSRQQTTICPIQSPTVSRQSRPFVFSRSQVRNLQRDQHWIRFDLITGKFKYIIKIKIKIKKKKKILKSYLSSRIWW